MEQLTLSPPALGLVVLVRLPKQAALDPAQGGGRGKAVSFSCQCV